MSRLLFNANLLSRSPTSSLIFQRLLFRPTPLLPGWLSLYRAFASFLFRRSFVSNRARGAEIKRKFYERASTYLSSSSSFPFSRSKSAFLNEDDDEHADVTTNTPTSIGVVDNAAQAASSERTDACLPLICAENTTVI